MNWCPRNGGLRSLGVYLHLSSIGSPGFFFVSGDDFETPSGEVWGDLPRLHCR